MCITVIECITVVNCIKVMYFITAFKSVYIANIQHYWIHKWYEIDNGFQ